MRLQSISSIIQQHYSVLNLRPPNPDDVVAVLNPKPVLGAEKGLAKRFAPVFELVPNDPNPDVVEVWAPNVGLLPNNPPWKKTKSNTCRIV